MIGVTSGCITSQLGVNPGSSSLGVLESLEDEDTCPLAHNETVATSVERTRSLTWIVVVACAHGLHGTKSGEPDAGYARLAASGEHDVGQARAHHAESLANGMGAGCAGADDGEVGTLGTKLDSDDTPGDIRDEGRYHERRYSPRPFLEEYSKLTLDRFQPAYAGANQYARSLGFQVFLGQARIGHGSTGSSKGEVHVTIVSADLLGTHFGRGIEILDLGSDLARNIRRIETSDGTNAGATGYERIPERVYVTANGGKNTKTGDDYARVGFCSRHGAADILEKTPREVQKKISLPLANRYTRSQNQRSEVSQLPLRECLYRIPLPEPSPTRLDRGNRRQGRL